MHPKQPIVLPQKTHLLVWLEFDCLWASPCLEALVQKKEVPLEKRTDSKWVLAVDRWMTDKPEVSLVPYLLQAEGGACWAGICYTHQWPPEEHIQPPQHDYTPASVVAGCRDFETKALVVASPAMALLVAKLAYLIHEVHSFVSAVGAAAKGYMVDSNVAAALAVQLVAGTFAAELAVDNCVETDSFDLAVNHMTELY